jgi:hypothetical protein
MINELVTRGIIYLALAGSIFACGFGFGVNRANKDNSKHLRDAMGKREKQVIYIDKIVTKYVDRISTREVPVYVKNDDDCASVSGSFRVFHDSAAADKGLPEAAGNSDAKPADIESVANTVARNYAACHNTEDQLRALQEWAREVSK